MNLAESDLDRLIAAIEAEGGNHLHGHCTPETIEYKTADKVVEGSTTGCYCETRFKIPYHPSDSVAVPSPIMEPDPNRPERIDEDTGDPIVTRRARTDEDGRLLWQIVIAKGDPEFEGIKSTVTVCAKDDDVGKWPRFKGVCVDPRSK